MQYTATIQATLFILMHPHKTVQNAKLYLFHFLAESSAALHNDGYFKNSVPQYQNTDYNKSTQTNVLLYTKTQ